MRRFWVIAVALSAAFVCWGEDRDEWDYAGVEFVAATQSGEGLWNFAVTVRHNDEGWEHYAVEWQVVDPRNGAVFASRILSHPHVDEQPFTRSAGGVRIPEDCRTVAVRARCDLHGWGGRTIEVDLERSEGDGYRTR